MRESLQKRAPAVFLFFLAPAIGELLSGSAPPAEFFNPFPFLLLSLLYGGGAIICRELTFRWDKGWPSLILLGAAYGIVEEGLMVKSFFNPNWMDAGLLGTYGRWGGVNWVWGLNLTIYHAAISIAIPIVLTGLVFPQRRNEPWAGRRSFRIVCGLFVFAVVLGFAAFGDGGADTTRYSPPPVPYCASAIAVAALVWLARRLPRGPLGPRQTPASTPHPGGRLRSAALFATGFLGVAGFFIIGFGSAGRIPAVFALLAMPGYMIVLISAILWLSGRAPVWSERQQWALVAGALGFFIMLSYISEFVADRPDNPRGMALVGLGAGVCLILLRIGIGRRARPGERNAAA